MTGAIEANPVQLAVLLLVQQLAAPHAARPDRVPQVGVGLWRGLARLEHPRVLTDGLRRRVPRHFGELGIDVFDRSFLIRDEDGGRAVLDRLRELAHLGERLIPFGDIAGIHRHRRDRMIERKGGKVPALVGSRADLALAVDHGSRRGDLADRCPLLLRLIRRKQLIEVITDRIRFARSLRHSPFGRLVGGQHDAIGRHQHDLVGTGIEHRMQAAFALAERHFDALALGDLLDDDADRYD